MSLCVDFFLFPQLYSEIGTVSDNLSKAIVSTDLFADYTVPTFVRWHLNTLNTPYKEKLTYGQEGFALVFGKKSDYQTVIAWVKGGKNMWVHYCDQGTDYGWSEYAQKSDLTAYSTKSQLESTFINLSNKRYVKITASETNANYGIVFAVTNQGILCVYNSNGRFNTLFESTGNKVKISASGLITTVDCTVEYTHGFVLRGGSLKNMPYEIS